MRRVHPTVIVAAVALQITALLASLAVAEDAGKPSTPAIGRQEMVANFTGAHLVTVAQTISDIIGKPIVVDEKAVGYIDWSMTESMHVDDLLPVLGVILDVGGFKLLDLGESYRIVRKDDLPKAADSGNSQGKKPSAVEYKKISVKTINGFREIWLSADKPLSVSASVAPSSEEAVLLQKREERIKAARKRAEIRRNSAPKDGMAATGPSGGSPGRDAAAGKTDSAPSQAKSAPVSSPGAEEIPAGTNSYEMDLRARLLSNMVDGKLQGFRVVNIAPKSIFAQIGLLSGDLVREFNGSALNDYEMFAKFISSLMTGASIKLKIERKGQPLDLSYEKR